MGLHSENRRRSCGKLFVEYLNMQKRERADIFLQMSGNSLFSSHTPELRLDNGRE